MKTYNNFLNIFRNLSDDFSMYFGQESIFKYPLIFFHNPGMFFSILYRFERFLLYESSVIFKVVGFVLYPFYFFITYFVLDYHIEPIVEIDGGLYLHNRNIVITDNTKIGRNFSCMGQVTIGTNFTTNGAVRIEIGDKVSIGTGAKIIASGSLRIDGNIIIGANAVVTKSLGVKGTYIGVPAKRILVKTELMERV